MKFTARANGKVNLHLGVGEVRSDGYHDLSTVFMAVDRPETVTLTTLEGDVDKHPLSFVSEMRTTYHVHEPDEDLDNPKNLAWKAVDSICTGYMGILAQDMTREDIRPDLPMMRLEVDKTVPVAGGMAGGSADAAAAVQAISALIAARSRGSPSGGSRLENLRRAQRQSVVLRRRAQGGQYREERFLARAEYRIRARAYRRPR